MGQTNFGSQEIVRSKPEIQIVKKSIAVHPKIIIQLGLGQILTLKSMLSTTTKTTTTTTTTKQPFLRSSNQKH